VNKGATLILARSIPYHVLVSIVIWHQGIHRSIIQTWNDWGPLFLSLFNHKRRHCGFKRSNPLCFDPWVFVLYITLFTIISGTCVL